MNDSHAGLTSLGAPAPAGGAAGPGRMDKTRRRCCRALPCSASALTRAPTTTCRETFRPTCRNGAARSARPPQTLTPNEVYALTAYVLKLNDIVPDDTVLDQDPLPKLAMPNRDGFTTKHGFMARDGKPDTQSIACMKEAGADRRT